MVDVSNQLEINLKTIGDRLARRLLVLSCYMMCDGVWQCLIGPALGMGVFKKM